jgi:predicted  nucleic acid-binding Zn-ribbon protein
VSCGGRVSQCNQFADVINQSQGFKAEFESKIEGSMTQASGARNLQDLQAAAGEYTAAVDQVTGDIGGMVESLEGLNISDEQLDEYRDRYTTTIRDSQAALTAASSAMQLVTKAKNEDEFRKIFDSFQTRANGAFSDLQALSAQEAELIGQVNAYCGAEEQ